MDKQYLDLNKYEYSNWEYSALADNLGYSKTQVELLDFATWLSNFVTSEKFYKVANEFIEIERRLQTEPAGPSRSFLVSRLNSLLDDYV